MSTCAKLRPRLRLGQADDADLGLGEHRGRHVGVVDRGRLAAEHGVGEGMALADRDRRQVDAVGDVADRVDVRRRWCANIRRRRWRRSSRVATPAASRPSLATFGARPVANITLSAANVIAAGELHRISVPAFSIAATVLPVTHLDAALLHLGAQVLAHVVVEAAQDVLAAIDQRHVGAEAVEDAGELDRDIAAALDHDAVRQIPAGGTPRSTR